MVFPVSTSSPVQMISSRMPGLSGAGQCRPVEAEVTRKRWERVAPERQPREHGHGQRWIGPAEMERRAQAHETAADDHDRHGGKSNPNHSGASRAVNPHGRLGTCCGSWVFKGGKRMRPYRTAAAVLVMLILLAPCPSGAAETIPIGYLGPPTGRF